MPHSIKHSVAIVIRDSENRFLVVKRAANDDSLPGVWGLPAASLRDDETSELAAIRAGRDKLGVNVKVVGFLGTDWLSDDDHANELSEYEVQVLSGTPSVPQHDSSVSQYERLCYTDDPSVLVPAARQGSLCSRILLRTLGHEW
jgi:ADP-ribose pyrophosphatase YjhB (NUDIX family)